MYHIGYKRRIFIFLFQAQECILQIFFVIEGKARRSERYKTGS